MDLVKEYDRNDRDLVYGATKAKSKWKVGKCIGKFLPGE